MRVPPGEVRDAIVSYLRDRGGAARVAEIHESVCAKLASAVPSSSVRSYLSLNTPQVFARVSDATYSLQGAHETKAPRRAPSSSAGTCFEFGDSRLFRDDCLDWLANRKTRSIHAVVTDPPYSLVEYDEDQQTKLREGRGGVWRIPPSFDGHARSPLPRFTTLRTEDLDRLRCFFRRWAAALLPALVPGAHVLMATNPLLSFIVANELAAAGLERRGEVVRLVMTMRGGDRPKNAHKEFAGVSVMPRSMWEPWLLFRRPVEGRVQDNLRKWGTGGLRRVSEEKPFGDVIRSAPTHKRERALAPHPSLKPQGFLRQVVRAILPIERGVVLDPFAGAGSTLAACEAVGYSSIGVEVDPKYFELAKKAIPRLASLAADPHPSL
jgi:site-specific DNA-methyltransferase (adenine-specific)